MDPGVGDAPIDQQLPFPLHAGYEPRPHRGGLFDPVGIGSAVALHHRTNAPEFRCDGVLPRRGGRRGRDLPQHGFFRRRAQIACRVKHRELGIADVVGHLDLPDVLRDFFRRQKIAGQQVSLLVFHSRRGLAVAKGPEQSDAFVGRTARDRPVQATLSDALQPAGDQTLRIRTRGRSGDVRGLRNPDILRGAPFRHLPAEERRIDIRLPGLRPPTQLEVFAAQALVVCLFPPQRLQLPAMILFQGEGLLAGGLQPLLLQG